MLIKNIINDWESVYPCLIKTDKNSFYSSGPFFLYGFSLQELSSREEYRVVVKLINLASGIHSENKVDNTRALINKSIRNKKGMYYDIPINFHKQYFQEAKDGLHEQTPIPFCKGLSYDNLVSYLLNIINEGNTSIVDFPLLEIEFLIQILSFYNRKAKAFYLLKELKEKLETLDKNRIDYFMGNHIVWIKNLYAECENPELIVEKAAKKISLIKNNTKLKTVEIVFP
jgi:hypothetical protein